MGNTHWPGGMLGDSKAMGGAAEEMGISCLEGESSMITVFDDFNGIMESDQFGVGTNWETQGWVLTDDAGGGALVADYIVMNDPNAQLPYNSCISIMPGTTESSGGNAQLDLINGGLAVPINNALFPHIFIDNTGSGVTNLDETTFTFACRLGLKADETTTGAGNWNGAAFIGWAMAADTSIMTHNTGVITIASDGPLVGFHIPIDGSIDGISHRTAATVMAEGTNFTELAAAGAVDGTLVNGAETAGDVCWWDLALRMDITDSSETTGNGFTTFYSRQVNLQTGTPGSSGYRQNPWNKHGTVLVDQTPASATTMVPTIEVLSGATAGQNCHFFIDWWAFGKSRLSTKSRQVV